MSLRSVRPLLEGLRGVWRSVLKMKVCIDIPPISLV